MNHPDNIPVCPWRGAPFNELGCFCRHVHYTKGRQRSIPVKYLACQGCSFANDLPPEEPSRGLGDLISKGLKAINILPCAGCVDRAVLVNKLVPFRRTKRKQPDDELPVQQAEQVLPPDHREGSADPEIGV